MADLNKFSFVKLNNSNWQCWKFRMEMLLSREELWYVVSEVKPEAPTAAWKKDDQKARATIGLCIEESQYSMVKSATSAKDYWDQLRAYHEKATVTSRVSLLKKLCNLNLSESGDVEHHLIEIEGLFDRLTVAGQELQDSLRIAMILRSLPDSYGGLVTALESRPDADLTMQLVKSKLLDEFERRRERFGDTGSDEKAMKSATRRWAKPTGSKSDSERVCYYCKKPGHFQRNCRLLAKQQSDDEKKKPDVETNAKQAKDERGGVCFMAGCDYSGSWFIDSGASCHMTNDKSFFSTISMSVGPNVVLADGKVAETAGCGEGTVHGIDGKGNVIDVKLEKVLYVPSLTNGLISVDRLTSKGFTAVFRANGCDVRDATGKVLVVGERSGCLYRLKQAETKVYGCQAYGHIPDVRRGIFERKARKLRFIGCSDKHEGCRFDTETDKVTISRDVRFLEHDDGSSQKQKPCADSTSGEDEWCFMPKSELQSLEEEEEEPEDSGEEESEEDSDKDSDESDSENYFDVTDSESEEEEEDPLAVKEEEQDKATSEPEGVRRSDRRNRGTLPGRFSDFVLMTVYRTVGVVTHSVDEPTTYAEAIASSERDIWKDVVDSEIQSLMQNGSGLNSERPTIEEE